MGLAVANKGATVTGTAGAAATLTITALAGERIAITSLQIQRATNVAEATGTTIAITTTNLPGTPSWLVGRALVAGNTVTDVNMVFDPPLVSSTAGTDVTIVCPDPGTTPQWNLNAFYFSTA